MLTLCPPLYVVGSRYIFIDKNNSHIILVAEASNHWLARKAAGFFNGSEPTIKEKRQKAVGSNPVAGAACRGLGLRDGEKGLRIGDRQWTIAVCWKPTAGSSRLNTSPARRRFGNAPCTPISS